MSPISTTESLSTREVIQHTEGVQALADMNPGPVLVFRQNDLSLIYANKMFRDIDGVDSKYNEFRPEREHWEGLMDLRQGDGIRRKMNIRVADGSSLCFNLAAVAFAHDDLDIVIAYIEAPESASVRTSDINDSARDTLHSISNLMIVLMARMDNLSKIIREKPSEKTRELLTTIGHAEKMCDVTIQASLLEREVDELLTTRSICNEWVERISDGLQDVSNILLAHVDRNYRTSPTETDLEDLLSRAIDASEAELKEWRIETNIDVSSAENVRLPKNVMVPVLSNLVKNAAQVMFNHFTFKPLIKLSVKHLNPQMVIIEIEDNGPGVPESQRERIFERGFTTKLKGQGAGLAFCKQAIAEIGGSIEVDSPVEHMGTIFRITIPVS